MTFLFLSLKVHFWINVNSRCALAYLNFPPGFSKSATPARVEGASCGWLGWVRLGWVRWGVFTFQFFFLKNFVIFWSFFNPKVYFWTNVNSRCALAYLNFPSGFSESPTSASAEDASSISTYILNFCCFQAKCTKIYRPTLLILKHKYDHGSIVILGLFFSKIAVFV